MLFNSLNFLVFFLVVTMGYFALPHAWRWLWLLVASCYFYMAFVPIYILIIAFTIVADYFAGRAIEKAQGKSRKRILGISLVANIGVLVFYKYYNFLNDSVTSMLTWVHFENPIPALKILLPIGLSFHTFQAMSYTFEVYYGRQKAEKHFGLYALYVLFYPQMVAGPIERPQNLLAQFREQHFFEYRRVIEGLQLMFWGLFKKVVIADRLAIAVSAVFDQPTYYQGPSLLVGIIFFSFQIYCDFSGYSDMARGAAKVMGFHLMQNFNRPYAAASPAEFWRRWHISLSTWFRDYVYIPLGGNRGKKWATNLFLVFLLSGIWHGAAWTFVFWGAWHGVYLINARLTGPWRKRLAINLGLANFPKILLSFKVGCNFIIVSLGWVFFRAHSLKDAQYIFTHLIVDWKEFGLRLMHHQPWDLRLNLAPWELGIAVIALIMLESVQSLHSRLNLFLWLQRRPLIFRWSLYYAAIIGFLFFGQFHNRQFIYFQF